ncbi:Ankyrin repeats (3 copies) [Popillia japonica]|uniref:Ankyrin repeats (3 copies) n=1 Tax=Popillia japonica TaxID=7064 RepID=A0AAW1LVC8_POPJA
MHRIHCLRDIFAIGMDDNIIMDRLFEEYASDSSVTLAKLLKIDQAKVLALQEHKSVQGTSRQMLESLEASAYGNREVKRCVLFVGVAAMSIKNANIGDKPIAFPSRLLNSAEVKYSQIEKKAATAGLAESGVKMMKNAILKARKDNITDIRLLIPRFLFQYRNTPHTTTRESPAKLLIDLDSKLEGELNMLHIACIYGSLPTAQCVIKKGVHVNMVDKFGYTPLDYIMTRLSSTSALTQINDTPLDSYEDSGTSALTQINDLLTRTLENDIDLIRLLVLKTNNADINRRNDLGNCDTFLCFAVKAMKLLLDSEADMLIEDTNGETPLSIVEAQESEDFIKLLENAAERNKHNPKSTLQLNHAQGEDGLLNIHKKSLKRTSGAQSELGMLYQYTVGVDAMLLKTVEALTAVKL